VNEKGRHGYRYIPGSIERTERNWIDFLTESGGLAAAPDVHFIPTVGGCFLVVEGDQTAGPLRPFSSKSSEALVRDFWQWLQKTHPIVPVGRSVMVIDDDRAVLKLLKLVLETSGYSVRGFGDAMVALGSIDESAPPDVLLVDLRMPGMDGRSFVDQVRAMELESKVIIISAYDAETAAAELGADGSLAKPFEPDELIELVKTISAAA